MKQTKTVLILEHEEKVFDKLTCDICAAESNSEESWAHGHYEQATTSIQLEERESYPAGGHSKEISFHLCPACFKSKLIPWLENQGAKPTVDDVDW